MVYFQSDTAYREYNFGVDPTGLIWYTDFVLNGYVNSILELTPQG